MTTVEATSVQPVRQASRFGGFVRGFDWGLRGLVSKELRNRSRGWRPAFMLTAYLVSLAICIVGFLVLAEDTTLISSPWLGIQLFCALAFGAVILMAFITPSLTAGAISGERERRTLDLLLVTRASTLGLVSGKLLGSLLYVLFLLVASLPAFALVYLFGGIPLQYLLMAFIVAGATAIAHASLGLMLSSLLGRTIVASVAGYIIVLAVVFGLPFVSSATRGVSAGMDPRMYSSSMYSYATPFSYNDVSGPSAGPPPKLTYASPMVALSSVLPTGTLGAQLPIVGELVRIMQGGGMPSGEPGGSILRPTYVSGVDPTTGQMLTERIWAPWLYYLLGALALVPFSILVSTAILSPQKPWQRRRSAPRPTTPATMSES